MVSGNVKQLPLKAIIIGLLLAALVGILGYFILYAAKQIVLEYSLKNNIMEYPDPDTMRSSFDHSMNSNLWIPFYMSIVVSSFWISGAYLSKRVIGNEYLIFLFSTLLISFIVFQFSIIPTFTGILLGLYFANRTKRKNNPIEQIVR